MKDFTGKKLLVLGGIMRTTFLIERAKKLGVYVIVADMDKNSPGKKIADKAILVNALDVDALEMIAMEEQIDGVISAHTDLLLRPWYELARRLNIPCYLTEDMIEMSTNKKKFTSICMKYDVSVPKIFELDEKRLDEEAKNLKYPVFIKPLDGSGARGAVACEKKEDFVRFYENARKYSRKGKVIVEECLTGTDIGVDYLIVNGEPYQISMHDRQMCEGRPSAVNHSNLQILPSKHLNQYKEYLDIKVKSMIKKMNFKNGLVFFQGFATPGEISLFEMGCRLGSTWNYIDEYFTGINPIDCLISYSLTGSMGYELELSHIAPRFNGYGAVITLLAEDKKGVIAEIRGLEEVEKDNRIKCILKAYSEGDRFSSEKSTDIALARFQIAADNYADLINAINLVYDKVDFLDEYGESLLSEVYDTRLLDYVVER